MLNWCSYWFKIVYNKVGLIVTQRGRELEYRILPNMYFLLPFAFLPISLFLFSLPFLSSPLSLHFLSLSQLLFKLFFLEGISILQFLKTENKSDFLLVFKWKSMHSINYDKRFSWKDICYFILYIQPLCTEVTLCLELLLVSLCDTVIKHKICTGICMLRNTKGLFSKDLIV